MTLELHPQQVQHIHAIKNTVEVVRHFHAELLHLRGHQRGRTTHNHLGTELHQTVHVATGHAAVQDVAHQCHCQASDRAPAFADGEDVEQPLSGVFMGTIASVHNGYTGQVLGQQVRGTAAAVPHHHGIYAHGHDVSRRVDERFALGRAAATGAEVDGLRAHSPRRQTEAQPGARAGFEEHVGDDLAREVGPLVGGAANAHELPGRIEQTRQFFPRQMFQTEQVHGGPTNEFCEMSFALGERWP